MRILLIEDDRSIAPCIELMLNSESFDVCITELGEEGVGLGKLSDHDIILLDLNLPDISGFQVLRTLRNCNVTTPVLILSALASVENKVAALGFGADDFLPKPFHKDELVARIRAIVCRSQGHAQSLVKIGDLCIDLDAKTVTIDGIPVHLTVKEYQMVELMSLRRGSTVTKAMFLNNLYGGIDEPGTKIIDVFICKLRKKLLKASTGKDYIETVWGRGWMLHEPSEGSSFEMVVQQAFESPSMLNCVG
jgi:two-component system cell cycle response regulator CtrA